MAKAVLQLFASYFAPRKLPSSNAAVDEVEVAVWESEADRCSISNSCRDKSDTHSLRGT